MDKTAIGIFSGGSAGPPLSTPPPNVSLGTPIITQVFSGRNNDPTQYYNISIPINLPTTLGTLDHVLIPFDMPDTSVVNQAAIVDARTDGDPNRAPRSGFVVGPASVASSIAPPFNPPVLATVSVTGPNAQTMASFQVLAPSQTMQCRAYGQSASTTVTNPLVQAGQPGETPSVSFTLEPLTTYVSGAEYAPLATLPQVSVSYRNPQGGAQQYDWTITWGENQRDPRYQLLVGYQLILVSPDGKRAAFPLISPGVGTFTSTWQAVPANLTFYTVNIVSVGQGGTNSITGATPSVSFFVQQQLTGSGSEYADLVTSLTASAKYSQHPGSGQYSLILAANATAPNGDVRWSGFSVHLIRNGVDTDLSGVVPGTPGQPIGGGYQITPPPAGLETWIVYVLSAGANNQLNSYNPLVTPSVTFTVNTQQASAPLANVTGFSVAYNYAQDATGSYALFLVPTFTRPSSVSWQSIEFWWQNWDGVWQVLGDPAESGTDGQAVLHQLPPTNFTADFLAVALDVNGKHTDGTTVTDPTAPPAGTPTFSLAIQTQFAASPLQDVTGFAVTPSYTNKDANGVPALVLTPAFTAPSQPNWQSIVFCWRGPGTPGGAWQILGFPATSGAAGNAYVEQLLTAATAGSYDFMAIARDVNGKDKAGNKPDPNAPPSGTPTISVTLSPYPSGGSGQEFTSLITFPSASLTYLITKDGVESVVVHGTLAPPTSDTSYAGVKLVMHDHAGVFPDVILAYTGPAATTWTSQRLPIDQTSVTWDVYFVSFDKRGNENSLINGITPEVASLVITAQTTGRLSGSRVDPTTLATQLAINSGLLGVAPGTIGPTQITPNSISTPQLTTSEITIGGGGSKPIRIRGFDHTGSAFFWIGDDTANSGFVGGWFKQLYVGGTGPATAQLVADSSGNTTFFGSLQVVTGTTTINIDTSNLIKIADTTASTSAQLTFNQLILSRNAFGGPYITTLTPASGLLSRDLSNNTVELSGSILNFFNNTASATMFDLTNGAVTAYNSAPTAGVGVVPVYQVVNLTGQTSAIAGSLLVNGSNPPAGVYRVAMYLAVTTLGTAGSISMSFSFNDGALSRTQLTGGIGVSGGGGFADTNYLFRTNGSGISYSVIFTGVTGSPQYMLTLTLERVA